MLIVERPQTDPFFNIAAEEYLLKNLDEDCFMLWQNEPSIILGKHQNAMSEINLNYVRQRNIPVIRRISGGGTVYHDLGNLNFTFIRHGQKTRLVDFSRFLKPIIEVLNQMGIPALQEGKSDIRVNGLKISGNSEHVYRNKVLHHGTLLFNSNLEILYEALQLKSQSFQDKSVKSVRSMVANISDFLDTPFSIRDFRQRIIEHITFKEKNINSYILSDFDLEGISRLSNEKYQTWKWNFGYSPDYVFKKKIVHRDTEYQIELEVNDGIIMKIEVTSNGKISDIDKVLKNLLIGANHNYDELKEQILKLNRNKESLNFDPNILLELLF